ncbi:uncharacterized protein L969DRAFT_18639 [Mixia osmundae IAM 14324]|uniref:Uncharacterized protein n=1 Tax=Mixia osmundae (strain CBS 9802 / IAM 14324 / JCM 22182 / KY 12970) TaxID=764103 RepID=G7EAC2_MIXOS|nr:uncharacterized protein L969DRAFT_18639 [Mixia osmundae IAM 14324]KEI37841.1 hypothetical protein L969DRAFT_18639 [Mixia osmundae IAM 14324]GAA99782.1 hypothetical protein E5Q_06485 [Mixia osmundae IAM 14324]
MHPAIKPRNVAVITGAGYGGIGYAMGAKLAAQQMRVALLDISQEHLDTAHKDLTEQHHISAEDVLTVQTDVTSLSSLEAARSEVLQQFKQIDLLHLNAGTHCPTKAWEGLDNWRKTLDVNLMGVVQGAQVFVPELLKSRSPGAVVVTGSKQGITCPPGNPAYNVSKAAVKAFAEQLSYELRQETQDRVSAHLLVPGWVHSKLTMQGDVSQAVKPGQWTPDQTVDVLLARMASNDFYIIVEDGDTKWRTDRARIEWTMGDMTENRPALSRWHDDHKQAFEQHMSSRTPK